MDTNNLINLSLLLGFMTLTIAWEAIVTKGGKWLLERASASKNHYFRSLFVDSCVAGLQQKVLISNTRLLSLFGVIVCGALALMTSTMATGVYSLRKAELENKRYEEIAKKIENQEKLTAEQQKLIKSRDERDRAAEMQEVFIALVVIHALIVIAYLWLAGPWSIRRSIAARINAAHLRFMRAIKEIASSEELKQLCLLDLKIVDEETGDDFLSFAKELGSAHGIDVELVYGIKISHSPTTNA